MKYPYWLLAFFILLFSLAGCGGAADPAETTEESLGGELAGQEAESRENVPAESATTVEPAQALVNTPVQEADSGLDEDVPAGFTADGFPYRGDPDAPITVEEYSDYLCPFCWRHFDQTLPALLRQYVAEGQLQYVFRDMPLVTLHPTAPVGHKAAACAGRQNAGAYWQMHDELFRTQNQWNSLPNPTAFVTELAEGIGMEMEAFEGCMGSGEIEAFINESVAVGAEMGLNSTPSFNFIDNETGESYRLIGAYPLATFSEWIDALLAGEAPPSQETDQAGEETAELPYWADEEGLAPDPDRPGYTLAGDQYKGNPEANVVVVEFSDFQCPACQTHALEVQPVLDREFVDTGEILWVFKHLPLRMHPQALLAATAAECAADQGHFWEMHDLLFEQVDDWAVEEPEPALVALAEKLGLEGDQFSTCLDSRLALERVVADMYDGQGIVSSTPNFVVLRGGRGSLLQSSRPADQFAAILQNALDATDNEESGE